MNYLVPDRIFGYLMAAVAALLMWTWAVIMLCHLAYRRKVALGEARQVAFRLPLAPWSNWLVLLFTGTVAPRTNTYRTSLTRSLTKVTFMSEYW